MDCRDLVNADQDLYFLTYHRNTYTIVVISIAVRELALR